MDEPRQFAVTNMADWHHAKFTAEQQALLPGALYGGLLTMQRNLRPTFESVLDGGGERISKVARDNPGIDGVVLVDATRTLPD